MTTLAEEFPHYYKDITHIKALDVYMVCQLWNVDPTLAHAVKKLLAAGERGAKDKTKDVREAMFTCRRWLEMQDELAPKTASGVPVFVQPR